MNEITEEKPVSKYFREQNGGQSAIDLLGEKFSSVYVVGFAQMFHEQRLTALKEKVEKLQVHYFHNTDEETADIANKTLEDVLTLIEDQLQ